MTVAPPTRQIDFSCRLLRQLLRQNQANVFISPAMVAFALGMIASGARGKTLAAIEETIGVDSSRVAAQAKRFLASCDRLPPGISVELANSLWAREGLVLSATYRRGVREDYRAHARNLDFTRHDAPQVINDWVRRATHGQLSASVDSIAPSTTLYLASAAYFHGLWNDPFEREDTMDHVFTTPSGTSTPVRLMTESGRFAFMEDSQVQAVVLPYKQHRFRMLVVLPRECLTTEEFDQVATPASLARIIGDLEEREGFVGLPHVELEYATELTEALSEMGMAPAFAPDADFCGLFEGSCPAFLSRALHKTRLAVDEDGTTAAALFEAITTWCVEETFEMTVDHPFLVALTESETGLPLFIGVIGDPTPA